MNRPYVTTTKLAELAQSLTTREQLILTTLVRVRLANAEHLERLHFGDVTRRQARQVLARMVERRLLLRLPRVIGGVRAGSGGYVYALDSAGARLGLPGDGRRRQPWSIGLPFLAHSLSVTTLYVRLVEAAQIGTLELSDFTTEPRCWRRFAGPGGGRVTLKPDAAVTVQLDRYEDWWFIEVDRGTESTSTLSRKCDTYRHYWQTGIEQARLDIFPRVLWLVLDERRQATLVDVLGRQPVEAWPLHVVTLFDEGVQRIAQGAAL